MAKKIPGQDWEEAPAGAPSDPRDLMDVFISGDVSLVIGHQNVGDKLAGADAAILQKAADVIGHCIKEGHLSLLAKAMNEIKINQ
jgi:hypothetical protein